MATDRPYITVAWWGVTRLVFLVGGVAIKVPHLRSWKRFLQGMLCNMQERQWGRCTDPRLAQVLFSDPFGFILVQRRAEPITLGELLNSIKSGYFEGSEAKDQDTAPAKMDLSWVLGDCKEDNFGWYRGRVVCVDYGS